MTHSSNGAEPSRRSFLSKLGSVGMIGGLVAAYGTLAAFLARFVYPARPRSKGWMYLVEVDRLGPGDAMEYRAPSGAAVTVARKGRSSEAGSFIALSSTCPHLGCQVHWEAQNDRFFCPCHNGTFALDGTATGGPPFEAGQSLPQYPLKVEKGLVFIEVPVDAIVDFGPCPEERFVPARKGVDPCLSAPLRRT